VDQATFRQHLHELASRHNCSTFDCDLWESVFTHSSLRNELSVDGSSVERLLEIIGGIGKAALRASMYEYCLDKKGMDSVQTSLIWHQNTALLRAILEECELVPLWKLGRNLDELRESDARYDLANRFLGAVIISSSYDNVRQMIWKGMASRPELLNTSYSTLDPKSWLQEYCQHFHPGERPQFELLSTVGPVHNAVFHCKVTLPDRRAAEGSARSRRQAERLAASAIIDSFQLTKRMPPRLATTLTAIHHSPGFHVNLRKIDTGLLRAAPTVAQKLRCGNIDHGHLAMPLTVPSSTRHSSDTNLRHKLLGDALEEVSFLLFAFQALPLRALGSSNISTFKAAICSKSQHARVFDLLGLDALVSNESVFQRSEESKADVIKAIAAAVYLSTRNYSQFFRWLVDSLGNWCRSTFVLMTENPLAVKEPKTFFQELLQGQESYAAEYLDQRTGPGEASTFTTTLRLTSGKDRVRVGRATGSSLKEAQQAAARQALTSIIPRYASGSLAPVAVRFWKSYCDRLLSGKPGMIVSACGVEHFRTLNSFAGFFGLKAFSRSLPELSSYLQKPEFVALILKSIGQIVVGNPVLGTRIKSAALDSEHRSLWSGSLWE
jgi:ribonuclease-3